MPKLLSICATVSLLFVSSAMAQSSVGAQSAGAAKPGVGACKADIKKVCAGIKPGGSRIATCLKEHVADLSDVCKARLAAVAAAGKTCRADVEKQCGTKTRRTQKVTCISDALTNLGDDCKAAIAAAVTGKK